MTNFFHFLSDDAGAVTIDWVALTAGILLLGIAVIYAIFNTGVASVVNQINDSLSAGIVSVNTGSVSIANPGTGG